VFDGLLWRPPPGGSFDAGALVNDLLETGDRSRRSGGFAFAMLYHPGGAVLFRDAPDLARMVQRLDEHQIVELAWMIRWHFVHQSRARAALRRHELSGADAAYLHRSLRPHAAAITSTALALLLDRLERSAYAGWGFHLALNLGATTSGALDVPTARRLLDRAPDGDLGVVTAVTTYEMPSTLLGPVQEWLRTARNSTALLRALDAGVELDGVHVAPPRFRHARPAAALAAALDLWPRARARGFDPRHGMRNAKRLRNVAEAVRRRVPGTYVDDVIMAVAQGDLRDVEAFAGGRGGDTDESLLEAAAVMRRDRAQGELFST
jgi:hypothetical protein